MFTTRSLPFALCTVAGLACGKPFWRSPPPPAPTFSGAAADPTATSVIAAQRVTLEHLAAHIVPGLSVQLADSTMWPLDELPKRVNVPRNWPDSVRVKFDQALADLRTTWQPVAINLNAVAPDGAIGPIHVGASQPPGSHTVKPALARLSTVGFSSDSTAAVIVLTLGGRGRGFDTIIVLLARMPDHAWSVWLSRFLSIS